MSVFNKSKLEVDIVNVGHGDCIIITWINEKGALPWHCIIDAGLRSKENMKSINEVIARKKISKFDLCILSHFDMDHIGGLFDLADSVKIDRYWSPYTPAFEKYSWLFGSSKKAAIENSKYLESELEGKGVILESPVEGCIYSPSTGLKLSVLSPPIKIYEKLLEGNDTKIIFEDYPAFLEKILSNNESFNEGEDGKSEEIKSMLVRLKNGVISRNTKIENKVSRPLIDKKDIDVDGICKGQGIEPEFFGNSVLNDTSIVLKLEFWTGTKWYSMLFPGDLENWLYLLAKDQQNINVDFYKVAHHGSKMMVGYKEAANEVIQSIRPDIAVISACGKYGLPRSTTRDALLRWSSSIFCTQKRGNEQYNLDGTLEQQANCCYNTFDCEANKRGINIKFEEGKMKINTIACQSTYSASSYPILQFQQHLIQDSDILTFLTEREINNHTEVIVKYLKTIHEERKNLYITSKKSKQVSIKEIQAEFLNKGRILTKTQIKQVIKHGYMKNSFWANTDSYEKYEEIYQLPNKQDISHIWKKIQNTLVLFFYSHEIQKGITSNLLNVDRTELCRLLESLTAFPSELIDNYCFPLVIDKIKKNFKIHSINDKWLMLVKNGEDYNCIFGHEINEFIEYCRKKNKREYDRDNFVEITKKFINEDYKIKVCSLSRSYNRRTDLQATSDFLYEIFYDKVYRNVTDPFIEIAITEIH